MERNVIPEMMDLPGLSPSEHQAALRGLRRLNVWTRNHALAWQYISRGRNPESHSSPLNLLDVATGAADMPIAISRYSRASHIEMRMSASDFSEQAIRFAEKELKKHDIHDVRLFRHDILRSQIRESYDVVMSSQFLHHLQTDEAVEVLRKMRLAAKEQVIVIDLCRSWPNLWQVWLATRVLSRSPVVHFDGPQSVRAAFTVNEFSRISKQAGFKEFSITKHWPCRFVFVGTCNDR